MIEYKGFTVRGCGETILNGIDLRLPEKGCAVLLGPSGCGKTTLLRTTIREDHEDPDLEVEGQITLDGVNIRDRRYPLTQLRRRVGLISQRPVPFPGTALENVGFALRCTTKMSRAEIRRRSLEALEEVGLEPEHYDTQADCLSGGQLKRLSIARTVALEPTALLMDEPSNGLDPLAVARLETLIHRLAEHRLVVVVTHDVSMARRIADRVYFLWPFPEGCQLVDEGSAAEVIELPRRPETRLFIDVAARGAEALGGVELRDADAEECQPRRIDLVSENAVQAMRKRISS